MKRSFLFCGAAFSALLAIPSPSHADFAEASSYLDLDGSFVSYLDFEGDGEELGAQLNLLYQQVLSAFPEVPPIPLDFPAVFETLGFGSIRAWALSSKELQDGLHRNLSVTLLDGQPAGLIDFYGLEPMPFTAAQWAPAQTSTAFSGQLHFSAIRDTLRALASQLIGPMGEGIVQQYLNTPLPGTDVVGNEIVEALSGRIDVAMSQGISAEGEPVIDLWVSLADAGHLLARLQSLAEGLPIKFTETPQGLEADLTALVQDAPFGLFLSADHESGALIVFTDHEWAAAIGGDGPRLADQPEFQRVAAGLPSEAGLYSYSAGFDTAQLEQLLGQNPELAPYLPLIQDALKILAGDFLAPTASAYYRHGDALIGEQYADYSYKQALLIVPAGFGVGLSAAMAIPAFQKVRQTSQEKAVLNNLRQYASAAQQFMLEEGTETATYDDLVGPGRYILSLEPVAGERYEDLVVTAETTVLSVTLADGRVVEYDF